MSELGRRLDALGAQLEYPPTPALAESVVARLEHPAARRWRRLTTPRALAFAALVVVAGAGALLAVSPSARSAVSRWLEVAGVRIERRDELPEIPRRTSAPFYGARTTLARGERELGVPVLVPKELGRPDAVFFRLYPPGGSVALVYGDPRRPRAVLTQYRGRSVEPVSLKVAGPETRVQLVSVGGARGVWLDGAPHVVYTFVGNDEYPESLDLVGNVLVWERERSGRAFRLEADISRERAIEIARSLE